jgi:hypothetical protein
MHFEQQYTLKDKFSLYQFTLKQKLVFITTAIALAQFFLHLGAMGKYGFHQDELLYLALSEHLAWGYKETPPFIALVGLVGKALFGDSLVAVRIIPALCAGAIVHLTGMLTIRLGGRFFAVAAACLGIAFSSAFLATGALFIPQVFDEFFWLLIAYLLVCYTQKPNNKYLYILGGVVGIGLLVKYTLILYLFGILIGFLLYRPHREIFQKGAFWIAVGIAFTLFAPHLYWQYQNGFMAFVHYNELKETQLIYLNRTDFMIQQLVVNGTGILLWPVGIYLLFKSKRLTPYRFLAFGFFSAVAILVLLNGKPYYAFGAFPPLFAAGALFYEQKMQKYSTNFKLGFLTAMLVPNLLLSVIVLPYLSINKAAKVFEWTYVNLDMHFPLKWEDQKIHNMNQNYADMIGWDELAKKTSALYQSLSPQERKQTVVWADNYGEAGAIDYYQEFYPLPKVVSLCSSYALWAPARLDHKNIIYISDKLDIPKHNATKIIKYGQINNQFSRVYGMDIYLIKNIDAGFKNWYRKEWATARVGHRE